MTTVEVACFGELLWDFFEADVKMEKEPISRQFKRELGGASANVAVALARLGVKTSAVGGVGDDPLGEALRAQLAADGVDVAHVIRAKKRTGITFVSRDGNGSPTFVGYRAGTADLALDEAKVSPASGKARFGVVSSTSMVSSARPASEKFLGALEKAKGLLVVDLNVRTHLWEDADEMRAAVKDLVGNAVVVKASNSDLAAVAGKRGMSWLEENAKGATWVLTRGENGAAAVGAHGQVTSPTRRVRCVDATGAGDAFLAGVLAVLVRSGAKPGGAEWKDGKLWTRALEIGHQLGSKVVSAVGATAGLVGLDDLGGRIEASKKS